MMKKTSIIRFLLGVSGGVSLSLMIVILMPGSLPVYIREYTALFCGAFIATLIVKDRLRLVGLLVSFIMILINILGFLLVSYSMGGSLVDSLKILLTSQTNIIILIEYLLYIPFSLLGVYFGWYIKKQNNKRNMYKKGNQRDKEGSINS